jgi:hypothetical protein
LALAVLSSRGLAEPRLVRPVRAPSSAAIADLDGDGKADLAVTGAGGDLTVLLGDGKGGLAPAPGSPMAVGHQPNDVIVADMNGDGRPDLVIPDHETDHVLVLLGRGGGRFAPAPGTPARVPARPHVHHVAAGDLDGDGRLDLVATSWEDDRLLVYRGDGRGGLTAAGAQAVGRMPYHNVALGDFNGDGRPDAVMPSMRASTLTVLLGAGKMRFAPAVPVPTPLSPFWVAVGDMNGDGRRDVAVAHYAGSLGDTSRDAVSVLLGDGRGGFTPARGSPYSVKPARSPVRLAVGDLDGDGLDDVAVANLGTGDVTLLLGGKDGMRPARRSPLATDGAGAVALGDLDGDGKADLVATSESKGQVTVILAP